MTKLYFIVRSFNFISTFCRDFAPAYTFKVMAGRQDDKQHYPPSILHFPSSILPLLLFLWVFLGPTNLFWNILPNSGYVGGLQIDYLLPKLYLHQLVEIALVLRWAVHTSKEKLKIVNCKLPAQGWSAFGGKIALLFACSSFVIRQAFTPFPISAFTQLASIFLTALSGWIIWQALRNDSRLKNILFSSVLCTLIFQSTVGLYQFATQSSIYGYNFLGEPDLARSMTLSRSDFWHIDSFLGTRLGLRTLPYGTTPHPNILGGALVALGFGVWVLGKKNNLVKKVLIFPMVFGSLAVVTTLSVTSWMTACLLTVSYLIRHRFKPSTSQLVTFIFAFAWLIAVSVQALTHFHLTEKSTAITRRASLNLSAIELFSNSPLFGTGLNQFTTMVESVEVDSQAVRFVQPAHHIFLLFLAENGVFGVLILLIFLKSVDGVFRFNLALTIAGTVPLWTLDHYLYTLHVGHWLFFLVFMSLSKTTTSKDDRVS